MNNNEKYWCAFSRLTKVSPRFVNILYNYFGSIEYAWGASSSDLHDIKGISFRQISDFLSERLKIDPNKSIDYIKKRKIDFIHPEDKRYPYMLRFIDNSPIGLFILGDISSCNLDKTLAVVGSRRASVNGKQNLRKILDGFLGTDICIVSGLAEGIDTIAHKSAIENNLKTIAIIGGGFDKLYPKSNEKLFQDIINGNGAVISEYWVNEDAISWHFPFRNRIVSGISKGVLIAEAALKSGAMITANLAIEQGKELMCMPGIISNPNTQGIYKLINDGIPSVTSAKDIMKVMNWMIVDNKTSNKLDSNIYTDEEQSIIDLLKKDALTLDELIGVTGIDINTLMLIITKLELNGVIIQISGEKYMCSI